MTTLQEIEAVLREVLDNSELVVTPETTAHDVDGWDSLSHVNVIVGVEARFKIRFSTREALTFRNVGDMAQAVDAKRAAR